MTSTPDATEPAMPSKSTRVLTIVFDSVFGLIVVAGITGLVVGLATGFLEPSLVVLLAVWTSLVSLLALPALAVLYFASPRVPLRERSALVASASWFGRVVWAGVVFAFAIVIGSVAGVVASRAESGGGLPSVVAVLSSIVLWPTVLCVVAVTYIFMAIRWCLDIGSIVAQDGGASVRGLLERHWTGPIAASRWMTLVDLLIEFGVAGVSRAALVLTLITVGLNVALLIASWN